MFREGVARTQNVVEDNGVELWSALTLRSKFYWPFLFLSTSLNVQKSDNCLRLFEIFTGAQK